MSDSTIPPRSTSRVTMRCLAEAAGVSVQAVSLALRNHPTVGRVTRERIHVLARQLGYAPDPHLVKLMHHLRSGREKTFTASVCALTTRPSTAEETFCDLLLEGAREAARMAGFALHVVHVKRDDMGGERLPRMLRQRGVEGLILLPMAGLEALDHLLDWREFSVVTATLSVSSPQFDRVVVDHFMNNFTLSEHLGVIGYRRPGLVIHAQHDQRCGHCITAAHAWKGIYGGGEPVKAFVCERIEPVAFRRWLKAAAPDVLLTEHDEFARELQGMRGLTGTLPLVSCSARPDKRGDFPFQETTISPARSERRPSRNWRGKSRSGNAACRRTHAPRSCAGRGWACCHRQGKGEWRVGTGRRVGAMRSQRWARPVSVNVLGALVF